MTILITGVGGYIGRRLAAAFLARGLAVRGIDNRREGLAELAAQGVKAIVGDVADEAMLRAALDGVTLVFHLAGSPLGDRSAIEHAALAGAQSLLNACRIHRSVRALVFASSGALYPNSADWLTEDTPPAPAFAYARAKYAAEQRLLEAYREHAVPVRIARIAAVYGPAAPALMIDQVRRGRFPLIGGGDNYLSNIQIDDALTGLIAIAERGQSGRIYNLADDQPTTVRSFYNALAEQLGAPPPPTLPILPARMLVAAVNGIARLRGRPGPLPPDLVAMAQVSHRMCNQRMHDELGLVLRYPGYREGLAALTHAV